MKKAQEIKKEIRFSDENQSPNEISPNEKNENITKNKSDKINKSKKYKKHYKQKSISILKKEGTNLLAQKNSNSIKWDNQVIDEQNEHKKENKDIKKMKSQSLTKYLNYKDEEDLYTKNLNKLNELKFSDECMKNMMDSLKKPNELNCGEQKYKELIDHKNEVEKILSKDEINVFDDNLDYESKITLKNTLLNKFHREIRGNSLHNLPCENLNLMKKE